MRIPAAIAISVSVLMTPVASSAQAARPERPYRGLFGSGYGSSEQSLSGSVSAGAGYDDNVYAGDNGSLLPQSNVGRSSTFTSFNGGLGYGLSKSKISLSANGSGAAQYYPDLRRPLVTSFSASTGLSWRASVRTSLSGSGTFTYEPLSAFSFFPTLIELEPGETPLPNAQPPGNYGTIRSAFVTTSGSVGVSHQLSRRSSLTADYGRSANYNTGGSFDSSSQSAGAHYSHNVAKGLGLRAGFGYTRANYESGGAKGPAISGRTIDFGVDYNRALSFSRRTTLSFATGSSAYNDTVNTSYFVTGNAALNHELGRSWNAALTFNRGVSFMNQLAAPTISDSMTAGVTGLLSRRVHFHGGASYSRGQVGLTDGNDYKSASLTTGASFDTNRLVSLSVQYGYYRYNFDQTGFLVPGVPPQMDRHSIQGNVSLYLPIFQRTRRPNASR